MALSYNLGYQESISVHPTRRQIFAGNPYSTFPNIWEWLIWANFPRTGKMVKMWHFFILLKLYCDQTVWFFQLFSAVLKRFCPLDSKNVFVLVLAHSEPELQLFEADDIGNDGDDDLSQHYLPNFNPTDKISSVQLRKLKKNRLVKIKFQKNLKMPHFNHFPRPAETDPYANLQAV